MGARGRAAAACVRREAARPRSAWTRRSHVLHSLTAAGHRLHREKYRVAAIFNKVQKHVFKRPRWGREAEPLKER